MFNIYVKLMEECSEVIHACSKVLKRGRHGVAKQDLSREGGVVEAIIGLMIDRGLIDIQTKESASIRTENRYKDLET